MDVKKIDIKDGGTCWFNERLAEMGKAWTLDNNRGVRYLFDNDPTAYFLAFINFQAWIYDKDTSIMRSVPEDAPTCFESDEPSSISNIPDNAPMGFGPNAPTRQDQIDF